MAGPAIQSEAGSWLASLCAAAAVWASLGRVWASDAQAGERVKALSASNWSLLLEGHWMVEFYAPWCPACQQLESAWEAFARDSQDLEITLGKVDVTKEPGVSGRFFVTTLPTIYHAKDGVFRRYRGSRTLHDLEQYILERKWEAVEPVAGWKSPSSITMHGMAGLFHLSAWIRQIHSYLTDTLGIHVWGSYAIFILATLLIGLFLGLILVVIGDCLFPPKSRFKGSELMDQNDDTVDEQQEKVEPRKEELITEMRLSDEEDEDEEESQEDSSDDSAVEGSGTEDDAEHHASDTEESISVRQRRSNVAEDEL